MERYHQEATSDPASMEQTLNEDDLLIFVFKIEMALACKLHERSIKVTPLLPF